MPTPEGSKLLFDIKQACENIRDFMTGKTQANYESDLLFRSAVERQLLIAGEAMAQLSAKDPNTVSEIPDHRNIVGFRNRLVHGYSSVSDRAVWQIATEDAPRLAQQAAALLDK